MRQAAIYIVVIAVVSFALGYYVGGSTRIADVPQHDVVNRGTAIAPPEAVPATDVAEGMAEPPAVEKHAVTETAIQERAITPQHRASLEKGARNAHAPFFHLYDVPHSEVDAIVAGMVQGQIEEIAFLEKMAILESRAPLGESRLLDEDQEVADALIAARKNRLAGRSRQLLGSYYDDYQRYLTTRKEHEVIAGVSTSMDQPINSVTRDELLQIMVEEELYDWQRRSPQRPEDVPVLEELTRDERLERRQQRIESLREKRERIKERARSYLSAQEYAVLANALDRDSDRERAEQQVMELFEDY